MIVMIENYDSFSYNIVQCFAQLGQNVEVIENDKVDINYVKNKNIDILLSPGPCAPNQAGDTLKVIDKCHQTQNIFGVCLGHQAIGQYFGGKIVKGEKPMHGKISEIHHKNTGIFKNIPSPFKAVQYNSLVIDLKSLPSCLEITAWTEKPNGEIHEIMAIAHKNLPIYSVQFHPESIASTYGDNLFDNWLNIKN